MVFRISHPHEQVTAAPRLWAAAYLVVPADGVVSGVENSSRIDAILYYDVGHYAVFFQMPNGVSLYYPRAWNEVVNLHVDPTTRDAGYFEIFAKDVNGAPIDPESFNVEITVIS